MSIACVFPGQGSQSVGMLAPLAERFPIVRETFAACSEAIGIDLWELAQNGPEDRLNATVNTQPVLLAAGVGVYRAYLSAGGSNPGLMAGHSLGEYCALVCAGSMHLSAAAQIVRERGRLMQEAVPEGQGAMAAVLNAEPALLDEICAAASTTTEVVVPANLNAPGQIVISGHAAAVTRAIAALAAAGVRRVIRLPVSVPSHSPLMRSAAEPLHEFLGGAYMQPPVIPVIANVDVQLHAGWAATREALSRQLYSPVRWIETVEALVQRGVTRVVECGPGKALSGMIKRCAPGIDVRSVGEPEALLDCVAAWRA